MRKILAFTLLIMVASVSLAQKAKPGHEKIYKLNLKSEIPITLGLFGLNYYGFALLDRKPTLDSLQISSLDKNDVWAFDRSALTQSTSQRFDAQEISDLGLNITLILPVLLALDKDIRQDWLDLIVLYLETQAISSNVYVWFGPMLTKRNRPVAYYDDIPFDERTVIGTTNSFFSGHTAQTASAAFFMAKVYSDYHPELGNKKYLVFAAAVIPTAFVGYYRYKGLKHFPTDIITGAFIGAATGILVPHFHKIVKRKNENFSIVPFAGTYTGVVASLKF